MTLTEREMEEALRSGRIAYEAYRAYSEESAPHDAAVMSDFAKLSPACQCAWAFAANAVAIHTSGQLAMTFRKI